MDIAVNNSLHIDKLNLITLEQKHYIEILVDNNLEYHMQIFWLNSWFDVDRAKTYLNEELKKIFIFLRNNINRVYWIDFITWNHEFLSNLPVIKLWWIFFSWENTLDQILLRRVQEERKMWLNYINTIVENIISLNFKLPTLEDDINTWKSKYTFSMDYSLTDDWIIILDWFLKFEWNSVDIIWNRMQQIRKSIAEVNATR